MHSRSPKAMTCSIDCACRQREKYQPKVTVDQWTLNGRHSSWKTAVRQHHHRNQEKLSSFTIDSLLSKPSKKWKENSNGVQQNDTVALLKINRRPPVMIDTPYQPIRIYQDGYSTDCNWRHYTGPTMVPVNRSSGVAPCYSINCRECQINDGSKQEHPQMYYDRLGSAIQSNLHTDNVVVNDDTQEFDDGKRSKRRRTIFTTEQLDRLEHEFQHQQYIVGQERRYLAVELGLNEIQVKVWFQNRRIKWRKQRLGGRHSHSPVICMTTTTTTTHDE